MSTIIYTHTDEAPALATYAFLPVIRKFTEPAGINVELADISVAGRVLALFSDRLTEAQRKDNELERLGKMCKAGTANIIKLPNVSASVPQLVEAIAELQSQGYDIPSYPLQPSTDEEHAVAAKYATILGSAVNPVLREGNSDRRVAGPVKAFAQANPKKMGAWTSDSRTHVAHMSDGDFFGNEQSAVMDAATTVKIEFTAADGTTTTLKDGISLMAGEVIDASKMTVSKLREFYAEQVADAKAKDMLLSLHLKATMMKVSDPIMFGHMVEVFFASAFEKHADSLAACGANSRLGLGAVLDAIKTLPNSEEVLADFNACYEAGPRLAMVDSRKGITNLHVPSDVIIDASMPNVIRDSGGMWNKDDKLEDCKAIIPDRCYATMYQQMVEFCKVNGQFDAGTMGNVANVGLMAQKAEEYGSHPNTFELPSAGTVTVSDASGAIFTHEVEQGDIWRMCQTKDAPIKDWVKLAVNRAKASGSPAIFWLNPERAHDRSLLSKVEKYLPEHDTTGLDITVKTPVDAIQVSMERAKAGADTISVTGNVLRDYLTDLFPILELGTSAKMLSIVPMLAGGAMYETGAGGSAPKHVQQFVEEGHLRWDSLGEYLALAVSLEDMGASGNSQAALLSKTLSQATAKVLDNNLSPSRKVNELDNRGTTFYIAKFWAEAMAEHDPQFKDLANKLSSNEEQIIKELIDCQGKPVDIGGYFQPDPEKTAAAMNPSPTLNAALA
jgi:isocitrate dehydrogenase